MFSYSFYFQSAYVVIQSGSTYWYLTNGGLDIWRGSNSGAKVILVAWWHNSHHSFDLTLHSYTHGDVSINSLLCCQLCKSTAHIRHSTQHLVVKINGYPWGLFLSTSRIFSLCYSDCIISIVFSLIALILFVLSLPVCS